MPKISVLVGIPCAGKSTFCKKYPESNVISRDAIRLVFFGKDYQYTNDNEKKVTRIAKELFDASVKENKDIIFDNTHCKAKYIDDYFKGIPEGYTLEVVFFDCPLWKAHIRNVFRYLFKGKWIPFQVINNMKKNFDNIDRKKYEQKYLVHK